MVQQKRINTMFIDILEYIARIMHTVRALLGSSVVPGMFH